LAIIDRHHEETCTGEAMKRAYGLLVLGMLIAGCGKQKSTEELVVQARGPDESGRLQAVRALSAAPKKASQVVPTLAEALKDPNHYVRRDAARALRAFGPEAKEAVPQLLNAARDRESTVRRAAVNALKEIDPDIAAKKLRGR
jgi:HEAT repeat protein